MIRIPLLLFYLQFTVLLIFIVKTGECEQVLTKTDSLRHEVNRKTGIEKVSAQLDLALQLYERENAEAQQMARSALAALRHSGNQALLMKAYFVLGRISQQLDNSTLSQSYYDSAVFISEELDDKSFQSEILLQKGISQHVQGNFLNALQTFNEAIQVGRLAENYRIVGGAYSMTGTIYRENGLYDRAIENILESRIFYEKASFTEGYAWDAYLLGRIYADLQLPGEALKYFQSALEDYTKLAAIDNNKNGLAICYEQIALVSIELKRFDQARESNKLAREIYLSSNSSYGISNTEIIQGRIEFETGSYEEAENQLQNALVKKLEMDDKLSQASIYEYLGLSMIRLGNVQEGLNNLQHAIELALEVGQKKKQLDIYKRLIAVYTELKKPDKVIFYQNKLITVQNELLTGGANIRMEQLQDIYEIEVKNSQILELKKQNEINELTIKQNRITNIFLITGILMAILISLIVYWFYRRTRQNNQKLYEANAAKDRFFAIIAHDLRGPTNTLTSFVEHLYSEFDNLNKKDLKELLQILHISSKNVSNLLENLLVWARSQTNKIVYSPEKLDMRNEILKAYEGLEQTAKEKEIEVILEPDSGIPVWADKNMVQTILRNVLSNSIKFTERGGKIKTTTSSAHNFATIEIKDTGIGIDADNLSKVFDIDSKFRNRGTENEMSTGLGLILVKDFVDKNGGTVKIESESGKGTNVIISLPLA
ncbi:MAG TPA: tetratricopeptide repeat-containing sensor histidine kinase [Draconibacterium sp.]|nr:tetratricopeptide repeat-containing sensor histidine kinase [Draconibacterium sp.]